MIEKIKINVLGSQHITNCYIIWDEETKEAVVVDPADKLELIEEKLEELNLKFRYVLLTHAHKDHTIALAKILEKYNIQVVASKNEENMLKGNVSDCSEVFRLKQCTYDMDRFKLLNNEDKIKIGNTIIKIIHTPGHTKGSACYYIEKDKILITGDTLFSDCFGRCDLPSSNIEDMANSLYMLYKNMKRVHIYPGHGASNVLIEDTYEHVREILLYNMQIDLEQLL